MIENEFELRIPTRVPLKLDDGRVLKTVRWRAGFSSRGLKTLGILRGAKEKASTKVPAEFRKHYDTLNDALTARLAGGENNLPWSFFDLDRAADFHVRVWKAMREIPFGKTETYGDTAERAGSPMAFRACGQACGANRILLFIPCHRVVGSSGLGGFGCGLDLKRWLLCLEGANL